MIGIKGAIMLAGMTGALAVVGFGYLHYTGLVSDLATSQKNETKLEAAVVSQTAATDAALLNIEEWKNAVTGLQANIQQLQVDADNARAETRRLQDIFTDHDLERLAIARPGLIENRINAGTVSINSMLQCASGGGEQCSDNPGAPN